MALRLHPVFALLAAVLAAIPAAAAEETCAPRLRAELNVGTHGTPLVTLTINGGPAHLLLDTGAERTTLTEDAARRLGLIADFDHAQTMRGVGGTVVAGRVTPNLVTAGGRKLPGLTFAVVAVHLPRVGEQVVDGLLGADMLGAYDLDLNIGHHLILLYDPPTCTNPDLPWNRAFDAIEAKLSRHLHMAVPITLDGQKLTAFIDTGAQVSLIDADTTMARMGITQEMLWQDPAVLMQGVSTEAVTAREHRFGRLGMADAAMQAPVIGVTPLRLDDADVLLGTDVLMRQRIWMSYATRKIYVALPE